jgi:hypothetical protein
MPPTAAAAVAWPQMVVFARPPLPSAEKELRPQNRRGKSGSRSACEGRGNRRVPAIDARHDFLALWTWAATTVFPCHSMRPPRELCEFVGCNRRVASLIQLAERKSLTRVRSSSSCLAGMSRACLRLLIASSALLLRCGSGPADQLATMRLRAACSRRANSDGLSRARTHVWMS